MAHFAEISEDNVVLRVVVVPDAQEHRGEEFLHFDLGLGGKWLQCSYNSGIRGIYPAAGDTYDPVDDVFLGDLRDTTEEGNDGSIAAGTSGTSQDGDEVHDGANPPGLGGEHSD